jgi:broad specificity phosphatase PhoE
MVKLFLIRHSKSCANLIRYIAGTEELTHPLVAASQQFRDPPLSSVGERMAAAYGLALRHRLAAAGIDVNGLRTVVGSSELLRAQQTAGLLFPSSKRRLVTVPHFTEHGALPENTPAGTRYRRPDWDALITHLHREYADADAFVIVGHGSFLRSAVWPAVTGTKRSKPFANLDGILVSGEFDEAGRLRESLAHARQTRRNSLHSLLRVDDVTVIPYTGSVNPHTTLDTCPLRQRRKIAATRRMPSRSHNKTHRSRSRKTRSQKGGSVGMPLAYFKDGAQMQGTTSMPTGTGLTGSNDAWARTALPQTGGRRTHKQRGGFSPAIMGQFAANGARVLPMAAYMGYRMMSKTKKAGRRTKKTRK